MDARGLGEDVNEKNNNKHTWKPIYELKRWVCSSAAMYKVMHVTKVLHEGRSYRDFQNEEQQL